MLLCFFEKIVLGVFSFMGVRDLARFSVWFGKERRVGVCALRLSCMVYFEEANWEMKVGFVNENCNLLFLVICIGEGDEIDICENKEILMDKLFIIIHFQKNVLLIISK